MSNKYGYLQIDFAFSIFIFFMIFLSVYSTFQDNLYENNLNSHTILLSSNSNDICKLIISNPGYPNTWENDLTNFNYIGLLKNGENFLDPNKIKVLNSTNYKFIIDSLNISSLLNIKIINISNDYIFLDFGAKTNPFKQATSISSCNSIYNNTDLVKVVVEVWE